MNDLVDGADEEVRPKGPAQGEEERRLTRLLWCFRDQDLRLLDHLPVLVLRLGGAFRRVRGLVLRPDDEETSENFQY